MSCRCGMTKNGISPKAHLGNGCTDLILVSQCSRLDYLKYLLRTALSTKSPVSNCLADFRLFNFLKPIN